MLGANPFHDRIHLPAAHAGRPASARRSRTEGHWLDRSVPPDRL
jgi:hypothetical protein